ncbi:MAG: ribosome recycling factor [Oscillospiraceae bacterium]|nr:ribosome recycling factor [Oscillospiraceae bacterium]
MMKDTLNAAKEKMQKTTDSLAREYSSIRAGRANPEVLNKVQAEYWGTMTPVTQMASVSVTEARTLLIQPYDASALKAIEKAILTSDIGINPTNDGKALRLVFPQLTEERRKELCKTIKKYGEEAKVSVRSVRRDTMDKFKTMKKNSEITEDDMKQCEKDLQKIVDKFCDNIDVMVAEKEKEILSI